MPTSSAVALGMWLARRGRNATLPYRPGVCLGGLLAVLLAPPGPGG